jgi:hypothetical protein
VVWSFAVKHINSSKAVATQNNAITLGHNKNYHFNNSNEYLYLLLLQFITSTALEYASTIISTKSRNDLTPQVFFALDFTAVFIFSFFCKKRGKVEADRNGQTCLSS